MTEDLRKLLEQKKQQLSFVKPASSSVQTEGASPQTLLSKSRTTSACYGVQAALGYSEHFLDIRLRDGNRVAFPYVELVLLNFSAADSRLDLNFRSGHWVCLYGTNLQYELYDSLRDCRVRWVAETVAETSARPQEAQIERIEIIPPDIGDVVSEGDP
jgi:hypothetical protein